MEEEKAVPVTVINKDEGVPEVKFWQQVWSDSGVEGRKSYENALKNLRTSIKADGYDADKEGDVRIFTADYFPDKGIGIVHAVALAKLDIENNNGWR